MVEKQIGILLLSEDVLECFLGLDPKHDIVEIRKAPEGERMLHIVIQGPRMPKHRAGYSFCYHHYPYRDPDLDEPPLVDEEHMKKQFERRSKEEQGK
jgi:hypothetical protein